MYSTYLSQIHSIFSLHEVVGLSYRTHTHTTIRLLVSLQVLIEMARDPQLFIAVSTFMAVLMFLLVCHICYEYYRDRLEVPPELPLTMSSQEAEAGEASDADVNKAPPYSQDGGGEELVPPPPGVIRRVLSESDLGRPRPSTLLPMYMDGREMPLPTVLVCGHCRAY